MKNLLIGYFGPRVRIYGDMKGYIYGKGKVVIDRNATFFGTIKAQVLKAVGIIIGDVYSNKLIVEKTGQFYYRNIQYQSINIHEGGVCSSIKSIIEEQSGDQMVTKLYVAQQIEKNSMLLLDQNLEEKPEEYSDGSAGKAQNEASNIGACSENNELHEKHYTADGLEQQGTPQFDDAKKAAENSSIEEAAMSMHNDKSNMEDIGSEVTGIKFINSY